MVVVDVVFSACKQCVEFIVLEGNTNTQLKSRRQPLEHILKGWLWYSFTANHKASTENQTASSRKVEGFLQRALSLYGHN